MRWKHLGLLVGWLVAGLAGYGQTDCQYCGVYYEPKEILESETPNTCPAILSIFTEGTKISGVLHLANMDTPILVNLSLTPGKDSYLFEVKSIDGSFSGVPDLNDCNYLIGEKGSLLFDKQNVTIVYDSQRLRLRRRSFAIHINEYLGLFVSEDTKSKIVISRYSESYQAVIDGQTILLDTNSLKFLFGFEMIQYSICDYNKNLYTFSISYLFESCSQTALGFKNTDYNFIALSYQGEKYPLVIVGQDSKTYEQLKFQILKSGIKAIYTGAKGKSTTELIVTDIDRDKQTLTLTFPKSRTQHKVQFFASHFEVTNPDGSVQRFECIS